MKFWKYLVVVLALGYAAYYYKAPQFVNQKLRALSFMKSGFETDIAGKPKGDASVKAIATSTAKQPTEEAAFVKRVVDGDTIVIARGQNTGQYVRYIGMNTPESVDPRKPVECFGKEAFAYNKSLVEGEQVKLISDVSDKDKYGRLLRYVYLSDGTFVNMKLVKDGYASVMTIPPDVKYSKDFVSAEREARTSKLGLWNKCK